jgi:hypothetical protein
MGRGMETPCTEYGKKWLPGAYTMIMMIRQKKRKLVLLTDRQTVPPQCWHLLDCIMRILAPAGYGNFDVWNMEGVANTEGWNWGGERGLAKRSRDWN